ncbi:hypothetical protein PUN28_006976 [Cardiocondyla obscurior]|uniref:Secreted protein n=1 Tax=Cardiocondyla obscurior TaxID=286306 RepID=A0AAW2G2Q2_9HYME
MKLHWSSTELVLHTLVSLYLEIRRKTFTILLFRPPAALRRSSTSTPFGSRIKYSIVSSHVFCVNTDRTLITRSHDSR